MEEKPRSIQKREGFGEAIVDAEVVDKVHADARKRSEKVMELRAPKEADGKIIQPLISVYPTLYH